MASILAGLTARSRCGEQDDRDVVEGVGDTARRRCSGPGRPGRGTPASPPPSASWSPVRSAASCCSGRRRARRPASSAGRRPRPGSRGGRPRRRPTRRRCRPPSGASTTTRSRLPAQPGSAGPGQATNGTGHQGSSTARSSRESGPAATTARGRGAPPAAGDRLVDRPRAASPASRRTRAPASARRRSASSALRERGLVVEPGLVEQVAIGGPRSAGSTGLVDQQHRDVVADRVGQAAAGADQLLGLVGSSRPWQPGQTMISSRAGSRFMRSLLIRASTSSRTRGHGRLVRRPRR